MKLWLDDIRPAPEGWTWVYTVQAAAAKLEQGIVTEASLDHDLGACVVCLEGKSPEQWLEEHNYQSMPNCKHFGTGYDLVCWMEETGHWPHNKPTVHSANPAGKKRMQMVIDKHYG